jgi:hypothetical protein
MAWPHASTGLAVMPVERRTLLALGGVVVGLACVAGAVVLQQRSRLGGPSSPLPLPKTAPPIESVVKQYPGLQKVVDDPKLGSVLKEFAAEYNKGGVEGARAFAKERGFMNDNSDITLTILTENDETEALEAEVVELKAKVVGRGDTSIDVLIPWSVVEEEAKSGRPPEALLERLSKMQNVRGILPMNRPSVHQTKLGGVSGRGPSEGVKLTHADLWQKAGFRGAGVRVGVLDPEVSKAPKFIGSALPANTVLNRGSCVNAAGVGVDDEGLHGVAAAEIVHEMAPDAQIFLACSLGNEDAAISWLLAQGVKIISYSAGGMYGPRNGTGRTQTRINQVTKSGVLWVNAAGNDGKSFHKGTLTGGAPGYWHAFAPGRTAMSFNTQIETSIKVSLIWSEWSQAIVSDYDLYLFDAKMNELARSENKNTFIRQPTEQISARLRPNTQYYVGVRGGSRTKPASFIVNVHGAYSIEYSTPAGSLAPPADATGALAVGAVTWNTDKIASYSSRGPTEDGRLKPDISAPTQVSSAVYGASFAGTSAACPHVAGAAAVLWGRFPSYSRNDIVAQLTSRARDLGTPGPDIEYGAGRLDLGDPGSAAAPPTAVAVAPTAPRVVPTTGPTATPAPLPTSTAVTVPGGRTVPPDTSDSSTGSRVLGVLVAVVGLGVLGAVVVVAGVITLVGSVISKGKAPRPTPAYQPRAASPFRGAPAAWSPPQAAAPPAARPGQGASWSAALVGLSGTVAGQAIVLSNQPVTIGRGLQNSVCIPVQNVSHRHAWVQATPQGCYLTDLGSSNGTFVNGRRVQQHYLQPGDVVTIGPASFRFDVRRAGRALAPAAARERR